VNLLGEYQFSLPTRLIFGRGASSRLSEEIKAMGSSEVLIVTDRGVMDAGLLGPLEDSLAKSGIRVTIFADTEPNPRDVTVERAALRAAGSRVIVALGGGSVIDAAKAVGVLETHGGRIQEYRGMGRLKRPITPVIAIPTTAGTGSEVTFWSVITVTRDAPRPFKIGVGGREMAPVLALLDPELTYSLPPFLTASTGMDALTHAIEAFTTIPANPITDALAIEAIRLIGENLQEAVENGGSEIARAAMLQASLLAGIAFGNSDLGAVHSMSEAVGGMYDTPHGVTNAVILPHVVLYNASVRSDEFAIIARMLGVKTGHEHSGSALASHLKNMNRTMGLPTDLRSLGVKEEDLPELVDRAVRNSATRCNPRSLTPDAFITLFEAAMAP